MSSVSTCPNACSDSNFILYLYVYVNAHEISNRSNSHLQHFEHLTDDKHTKHTNSGNEDKKVYLFDCWNVFDCLKQIATAANWGLSLYNCSIIYTCAYIYLRFKHIVLGTHLSHLGSLFNTVS